MSEDFERNSQLISALKRLERAGSEESRATEKLHGAARVLAAKVGEITPRDTVLPRGYVVQYWHYDDGQVAQVVLQSPWYGEHGQLLFVDAYQTREVTLKFASDVSSGWLDELADWLEARGAESAEAAVKLQAAAEAVR